MIGRKMSGPKLIDSAIAKFSGIVATLKQGIAACQSKQEENEAIIDGLTTENENLSVKIGQASTFSSNLEAMMSDTIVTE